MSTFKTLVDDAEVAESRTIAATGSALAEEEPAYDIPQQQSVPLASSSAVRIGVLLILTAGYLVYALSTRFGFVYDDFSQIVWNPRVHSTQFLPQYFTSDVWAQVEGHPQNLYRPLFLTWLLANFKAFGVQPSYWHLTTILMHILASLLVYFLARKLIPNQPVAALVAAAVFVLHPSHVEAVAWISGVTEPLASVLFLGSFLCYIEYRRRRGRVPWLVSSLFLCGLAMLAKETAVVLPAVIVAYEWFVGFEEPSEAPSNSRRNFLPALKLAAPHAVLAATYLVLRITALHGLAHSFRDVPLWKSLLTLPWVLFFYVTQLFVPSRLGPYYDVDYVSGINVILPIVVLVFAALAVRWWAGKTRTRLPLFLSAWFLLTLAPALALFVIGSRYFNLHDRYLYLPSVAFALFAGQVVAAAFENFEIRHKRWLGAVAVLSLAVLGFASYKQVSYWKDNFTLFQRGAAVAPHNLLAKLNLASALFWKGSYADALAVSEQAVNLEPKLPVTLNGAAQAAYFAGNYSLAESYYSKALALAPPQVDQLYYLGLARLKMSRYQEALEVLEKGNSLWPNSPGYHMAMGHALAGEGKWAAARDQFRLELNQNPQNQKARDALAEALAHLPSAQGPIRFQLTPTFGQRQM